MADLLTQSWMRSFPGPRTAIARAGNVIGGGDVSTDRLLPDLVRSFEAGTPAQIRYPSAVRPWQHVLDCLNGYCMLLDAALASPIDHEAWNFGPGPDSFRTVAEVADLATQEWGGSAQWLDTSHGDHPHEAGLLALDASVARNALGWADRLTFHDAVAWTIDWHQQVLAGASPRDMCITQLETFNALVPDA